MTLYKPSEFIRKTANGKLDLVQSLEAVHELAEAASYHQNSHILIDVRETESTATHLEQMRLALEFGHYRHVFHNKIACLSRRLSNASRKPI